MANYRQGEVLIFGVDKKTKQCRYQKDWHKKRGYRQVPDNVIIEGELAGHKHEVVNGKLYDHPDKKDIMILEAGENCVIKHPEHKPISMPKGTYEIKIQREFDGSKAKSVKD